jgi:hypothetical protein
LLVQGLPCQKDLKIRLHLASPNGDTLSKDQATPFVVNYELVDTDKDGKISQAEFQAGCSKGWIQKPDASTVNQMKGSQ